MRDRRSIAVHRGGPLTKTQHRLLATWSADCAERLLPLFEASSSDDRPRRAIETARAWTRGEIKIGVAQKAAVAAHAAARSVTDKAAVAVARACGHAVATAHFADHCLGLPVYGLKAVQAAGGDVEAERDWQIEQLPAEVRELVVSAIQRRHGASRK